MTAPRLTFKPASKATRADFEAVFEGPGGPKYCWCMAWREMPQRSEASNEQRRDNMLGRIDSGEPVGILGYHGGEPVAWVSIAPRETYRPLGGPEAAPGECIWSLACMYMRRKYRGQGLAHKLIAAAVARARRKGATAVEAYPVDPESPSYRFMGFVPAFETAGFVETGMAGSRRRVMRLTLSDADRGES